MRRLLIIGLVLGLSACNCGGPGADPGHDPDGGDVSGNEDGGGTPGTDGGEAACLDGLGPIQLSPTDSTVTLSATPSPISFSASGALNGGAEEDLTSRLQWTATRDDDTPPGTFSSPGVYQPEQGTGGVVTVTAADGCGHSGSTKVTLKLEATFQQPDPSIVSRFDGNVVTGDATKSPSMIYPSDQTRFPRNLYKVLFQWKRAGHDYFRVTFEGPYSKTVVYTDGNHGECSASATTAGCFEADAAMWQAIAGANAGAVTTVTVEGVIAGDSNVYRAAPIEIGFSKRDVKGAIFYWSTTAAGIRRASVSDAQPEAYVVAKPTATELPENGSVKCVACHTVSRSGKKMFAFTQAGKTGEFVYDVTLNPPPTPVVTTEISTQKGFGAFSPDDQRVVATVGSLLAEFDANTGAKISDVPVAAGTNPDWSPAGNQVAYSSKGGDSPGSADLNVIAYDQGTWGASQTLVPADGKTNLFPSYSPDGQWIAYARGKGGHGDTSLQLWMVKADGTGKPIELKTANRIVNGEMTAGQHENNMPTWAPPGDYDWIAFNSVRPYGVVYPKGGMQQIWVAAVDRNKLASGEDPTFPAFRFAFQGLTENNHRAFWTLDVRDPPDGGSTCASLGETCEDGTECCLGTVCTSSGELGGMTCQPPPADGGMCLPEGSACDQTSGPDCCEGSFCDSVDGGATFCRTIVIN